jgi:hypothetical protein
MGASTSGCRWQPSATGSHPGQTPTNLRIPRYVLTAGPRIIARPPFNRAPPRAHLRHPHAFAGHHAGHDLPGSHIGLCVAGGASVHAHPILGGGVDGHCHRGAAGGAARHRTRHAVCMGCAGPHHFWLADAVGRHRTGRRANTPLARGHCAGTGQRGRCGLVPVGHAGHHAAHSGHYPAVVTV